MDEYAVCEGDELFQCVGNGVVECVVHFDVFDHASGAGCEAEGGQEEEKECFHNVKKRLEIKPAKGSRSNVRHKLKGGGELVAKCERNARYRVFFDEVSAKVKSFFEISKCWVFVFVAMIGFPFDV